MYAINCNVLPHRRPEQNIIKKKAINRGRGPQITITKKLFVNKKKTTYGSQVRRYWQLVLIIQYFIVNESVKKYYNYR